MATAPGIEPDSAGFGDQPALRAAAVIVGVSDGARTRYRRSTVCARTCLRSLTTGDRPRHTRVSDRYWSPVPDSNRASRPYKGQPRASARGDLELMAGIEPAASALPRRRSTCRTPPAAWGGLLRPPPSIPGREPFSEARGGAVDRATRLGAAGENCTRDPTLTRRVLCCLSYGSDYVPIGVAPNCSPARKAFANPPGGTYMAEPAGFEPALYWLTTSRGRPDSPMAPRKTGCGDGS